MTLLQSGLAKSGAAYTIDNSVRLAQVPRTDGPSPSYFKRLEDAWAGDGNLKTWTISWWMKHDVNDDNTERWIYWVDGDNAPGSMGYDVIYLLNQQLTYYCYVDGWSTQQCFIKLNRVFRDPSAWYHCMIVMDTTLAAAADRTKFYINGERETSFATDTQIDQDDDTNTDMNANTYVGASHSVTTTQSFGGYIADFYRIDGQALGPEYFGELDSDTNQWKPINASGLTFGDNGFYLDFADGADLGDDASGEGNDFTPINLAATDQMVDSPTNNFPTMNNLVKPYTALTYSEGNLQINKAAASYAQSGATIGLPNSGKWYWEMNRATASGTGWMGIAGSRATYFWTGENTPYLDTTANCLFYDDAKYYVDGSNTGTYGATWYDANVMAIALNLDDNEMTLYKNNVSQGVATISGGMLTQDVIIPVDLIYGTEERDYNFGQNGSFNGAKTAQGNADDNGIGDFYYAPPSGFLALCSSNLSDPEIALPGDNFNTVLWTGNGVNPRTITGVGFEADMTWLKSRSQAYSHQLYDQVRGAGEVLYSNTTSAEYSEDSSGHVSAWTSNGFTLYGSSHNNDVNGDTYTYVAWNWLAGTAPTADNSAGAGATPTAGSVKIDGSNLGSALAGSIAATRLSANTTSGFSIISYTGNDTNGATVAHGLSSKPDLIIVKALPSTTNWPVYNSARGATKTIWLDDNSAEGTGDGYWYDTEPTASVFSLGRSSQTNNTVAYIAYAFHSVEGYSAIGAYTGNGSTDGPYIYTGFRPAFVMYKCFNQAEDWYLLDDKRDTYNVVDKSLIADSNAAEVISTASDTDFLSNGFKLKTTTSGNWSGYMWVYLAFAESPFKYANAR